MALAAPYNTVIIHYRHHCIYNRLRCLIPCIIAAIQISVCLRCRGVVGDCVVVPQHAGDTQFLCPCQIIGCPVASCGSVVKVRSTEFAQDNRDILIREIISNVREQRIQITLIIAGECSVVAVAHSKRIRRIRME